MNQVRPPAVAGMFYPDDRKELAATVDELLANASQTPSRTPKALVVPHAGYIYSGAIAASGYVRLRDAAPHLRRVVLLGPAHRVWIQGLALPDAAGLETPLGILPVDGEGAAAVARLPQV